MAQSQLDFSKLLKKPRLLNIPCRVRDQCSEQNSIFSTRSSYDPSNKSSISRGEFTFRNSEGARICEECLKLKNQLNELQKLNLGQQEKQKSSKKYFKQMTSLLGIKASRLREEETILKAEKEALLNQKDEFQRKTEKFNKKCQEKIQELERAKKEFEEKMKKLEGIEKDLKFDRKLLKNQIKNKMIEKFTLRETIILRSQQELVSKEESFRQKYLEKNLSLAKREEKLNEIENRLKNIEKNMKVEKDELNQRIENQEKMEIHRFEERSKCLEIDERNFRDEIKKLELQNHEKDEIIRKLSMELTSKSEIQSLNNLDSREISDLTTELQHKLILLIEKEKEIQVKENLLLDFSSSLHSKELFLTSLDHSLSQLSQTLNTQKTEIEALSCSLNKQNLTQTSKLLEIESSFEVVSKYQTELIQKSENLSENAFLMKHLQTLLEKKRILLTSKETILKSLRM